jgi:xanthine dehydrogenase YagR molybdenum-binding subunit
MSAARQRGAIFGRAQLRIDGRAKVTGAAIYPSDEPIPDAAHAFLLTSAIARGRIKRIELGEARAVEGVLDILTHENVGTEAKPPKQMMGGESTTTLESDRIWHDGQIIGVVVAESYEIAREAAYRVHVHYEKEKPSAGFDSEGAKEEKRKPGEYDDFDVGDAERAFADAEVKIDAWYETPTQHHNPIELFTTTCVWKDGRLTIWEPSQFVYGLRGNVAQQLGIEPEDVRVISKFIGGAFGSKGGATARTAWIAVAARRLKRPVKLVATRDQGFTIATYRAETRHHIRLGATRDGKLVAFAHEGWEVTSRPSNYNVSGTETTARMYACPNILTKVSIVHADRNTPGFMRAPPDTPYMFPLESAMDELAAALGLCPIELRRRNDTERDPATGKRFSGRKLMECFDRAAERFGWRERTPQPGSMHDGDWLVGWGCASAAYPSNIAASAARVTLTAHGSARVEMAGQDIGTGAYTVAAMTAAERLGLQLDAVNVEFGDTRLPPAPLAAGSSHTASIVHAITTACERLKEQLALPPGSNEPIVDALRRRGAHEISCEAEHIPKGLKADSMEKLRKGQLPMSDGMGREDVTAYAFGAQFVEVRVHRRTREIRVPRMVGAFAAGTIVNPLAAHSQYMGGMIWGIGAALLEKTEIDPRFARYINNNISEYHIPVNADVCEVDVIMVPEEDREVNPMGVKGIGEIGIVGVNAAIANAVFHATGRRVRRLPIRMEDML